MQHPEAGPVRLAVVLLVSSGERNRGGQRDHPFFLFSDLGFSHLISSQDSVPFLQHQQLIGINALEGLDQT